MDEMKINEQCLAFIPKHVHKRGKKNDEQQRFHAAEYDFERYARKKYKTYERRGEKQKREDVFRKKYNDDEKDGYNKLESRIKTVNDGIPFKILTEGNINIHLCFLRSVRLYIRRSFQRRI